MAAIAQTLETIVGSEGICPWEQLDSSLKQQLLQSVTPKDDPSPPVRCVVYPNTQDALAEVMACAHQHRWRVLPCGSGSQLSWGGLAVGADVAISTQRLNRLLDHAVGDLTFTAEAGMKWVDVQTYLDPKQQFLALDPTYPKAATLGGMVATADAGSLRQRYGSIRDMLLGISFVRSDGQIAKAGGRVVKNVAGYDLMKLLTGSYGSLGMISQVTFRLYPRLPASRTVVITGTRNAIAATAQAVRSSSLSPVALDLLSTSLASDLQLGTEMALIARFQSIPESVEEQCHRLTEMVALQSLTVTELVDAEETALWQRLKVAMAPPLTEVDILCKIGVLPAQAADWLADLPQQQPQARALIHSGSGLGRLYLPSGKDLVPTIQSLRSQCQTSGGFLTLLQAAPSVKQQVDVWGYTGNAFALMEKLKHQFDPLGLLSPQRFVGGL